MVSRFLAEVSEQPEMIRRIITEYEKTDLSERLSSAADLIRNGKPFLTGMGSSYHSGIIFQYLHWINSCQLDIYEAGEFLHYGIGCLAPGRVCIAVSQSGESAETIALARRASEYASVIGLTNDTSSTLARLSEVVLPLLAGDESTISTKTFLATLAVLYVLSDRLQLTNNASADLARIADVCESLLFSLESTISLVSDFIDETPGLSIIGRGFGLPVAMQAALILKEGTGLAAEALSGGAFRHGPIDMSGPGHVAIMIAPFDRSFELQLRLGKEIASNGSRVVFLTDRDVPGGPDFMPVTMPTVSESLVPFVYIIPFELLLERIARRKGRVPGTLIRYGKITANE